MPLDRSHQHISNDVMSDADPHTPILTGDAAFPPDEWTLDADGGLSIGITDTDGQMRLILDSSPDTRVSIAVTDTGNGATHGSVVAVGTGGGTGGNAGYFQATNGSAEGTAGTLAGDGTIALFTTAGRKAMELWDAEGNVLRYAILPAGQIMTGVVTAPADGDLSASQVALWFDDTNGAAKLKIKGKSANGTIVTGTVNLS